MNQVGVVSGFSRRDKYNFRVRSSPEGPRMIEVDVQRGLVVWKYFLTVLRFQEVGCAVAWVSYYWAVVPCLKMSLGPSVNLNYSHFDCLIGVLLQLLLLFVITPSS